MKENLEALIQGKNKEAEMLQRKEHFKILSDLFVRGTADVSNDARWVGLLNKPKGVDDHHSAIALENWMQLYPEDVAQAIESAKKYRDEMQNDGINRKSLAFYCLMGCAPECVSKLFNEVYTDTEERRRAWRVFFNRFPAFKVTTRKL